MASDQQLVARILSGDTAAVPELEEKYRGSLVDVAQRSLGMSQFEAEEAVQQLFVGLLADDAAPLRRFGWRCALSTWLYALIPRKSAVPSKRGDISGPGINDELAGLAPGAFSNLTDHHRLLLQLSASDGLSYSEIARLTKSSIGDVTNSCFAAKLEFSQSLGILPPPRPEPVPEVLQPASAESVEGAVAEEPALPAAEEQAPVEAAFAPEGTADSDTTLPLMPQGPAAPAPEASGEQRSEQAHPES